MAAVLLATLDDLQTHSQRTIPAAVGTGAIRMASAWLMSATRITPWPPDPVPEDLWSWCVELATLIVANPDTKTTRGVGGLADGWATARKGEILDAARERYGRTGTPVGSFPQPASWPERSWLTGVGLEPGDVPRYSTPSQW